MISDAAGKGISERMRKGHSHLPIKSRFGDGLFQSGDDLRGQLPDESVVVIRRKRLSEGRQQSVDADDERLHPWIVGFVIGEVFLGDVVTNGGEVVDERLHPRFEDIGSELRQAVIDEFLESLRDAAHSGLK